MTETAPKNNLSNTHNQQFSHGKVIQFLDEIVYEIEGKIGEGITSEVYLAIDKNTQRKVALKVLKTSASLDETLKKRLHEIEQRFVREGKITARLDHPNIIKLYTTGEMKGRRFLATEYVQGETLRNILSQKKKFSPEEATPILLQVADGLQYLHSQKILHRDLNPNNIMLNEQGSVKILDFGISKNIVQVMQTFQTMAGENFGTPAYMSPEQMASSKNVDEKTDIFSLGVTAFQMLTGRIPYDFLGPESLFTRLNDINKKPLEKEKLFEALNKKEHGSLGKIIRKALQPKPYDRCDAQEFYDVLLSYSKGENIKIRDMPRRKFIQLIAGGTAAALLGLGGTAHLIIKHNDYQKSILSTIDKIQKPGINSLDKLVPLLRELEPKLYDRYNWIFETRLIPQIESQKTAKQGKIKDMEIYPFATTNSGDYGLFLKGNSTIAGHPIAIAYYTFEEFDKRYKNAASEKEKNKLKEIRQKLISILFQYTDGLYFEKKETGNSLTSDERLSVMHRFFTPIFIILNELRNNHPVEYNNPNNQNRTDVIMTNYAKAIKIAIEKRYNPYKKFINWNGANDSENKEEVSPKLNREISEMLCYGFQSLNLKEQVFTQFSNEYSDTIKNPKQYLEIILNDGDARMNQLAKSEKWKKQAESKDYAGLITDLIHKKNLLEDIISFRNNKDSKLSVPSAFLANFVELEKDMKKEEFMVLESKEKEYDSTIKDMIVHYVSNSPTSMISRYYLDKNKTNNPVDNIATLRFLEAVHLYSKSNSASRDIDLNKIQFKILENITSEEFISWRNSLPVSKKHPYGLVKECRFEIGNPNYAGGTYIETDMIYLRIIKEILNKK